MKVQTFYEWDYETVDENGDIVDHNHADKLSQFKKDDRGDGERLVLVRDTEEEDHGLQERYWAYVKDEKLPKYFVNSFGQEINIKVPQKYHKELENYFKKLL